MAEDDAEGRAQKKKQPMETMNGSKEYPVNTKRCGSISLSTGSGAIWQISAEILLLQIYTGAALDDSGHKTKLGRLREYAKMFLQGPVPEEHTGDRVTTYTGRFRGKMQDIPLLNMTC